jgi:hypothetical protein
MTYPQEESNADRQADQPIPISALGANMAETRENSNHRAPVSANGTEYVALSRKDIFRI